CGNENGGKDVGVKIVRDQKPIVVIRAHAEVNHPVDDSLEFEQISRAVIQQLRIKRGASEVGNVSIGAETTKRTDPCFREVLWDSIGVKGKNAVGRPDPMLV